VKKKEKQGERNKGSKATWREKKKKKHKSEKRSKTPSRTWAVTQTKG